MKAKVLPGPLAGSLTILPSKSHLHRLLICAALADKETFISSAPTEAEDVAATMACLTALGATIRPYSLPREGCPEGAGWCPPTEGWLITPIDHNNLPTHAVLPCRESGSTFRFMLPLVCALGVSGEFHMAGRLPERPLAPLDEELTRQGITLTRPEPKILCTEGKLQAGDFLLPGNVSSQYITGLLMALPLLTGDSTLTVEGRVESADYIHMTREATAAFGRTPTLIENRYEIQGGGQYQSPGTVNSEGDWSNAAFWLCAGAMPGGNIALQGLDPQSRQGDKALVDILAKMGAKITWTDSVVTVQEGTRSALQIDAAAIPDLIPVLSAVAAVSRGYTVIKNAARLRLKESDRLAATATVLNTLGAKIQETPDGLKIEGVPFLTGGTVDAWGDHRIAMMAAIASTACKHPVTITGAEAVRKSYPQFWQELAALGKEVHLIENL